MIARFLAWARRPPEPEEVVTPDMLRQASREWSNHPRARKTPRSWAVEIAENLNRLIYERRRDG